MAYATGAPVFFGVMGMAIGRAWRATAQTADAGQGSHYTGHDFSHFNGICSTLAFSVAFDCYAASLATFASASPTMDNSRSGFVFASAFSGVVVITI